MVRQSADAAGDTQETERMGKLSGRVAVVAGREYQLTQTLKGLEVLASLPLTEEERADIAGRNFRPWVGLDS